MWDKMDGSVVLNAMQARHGVDRYGVGIRGRREVNIPIAAIVCDTPTVAVMPNNCQNK